MSVTVTSTTDTSEAVTAAQGGQADKNGEQVVKEKPASGESSDETPEDSEASEINEDESEGEDGDETAEVEKPEERQGKGKGRFKKRIDRLSAKVTAAETEKEYWKREALKSQRPAEVKSTPVETKVDQSGKPNSDKFDSHEEYVEALADWKVEQKLSARDEQKKVSELKSEQQKTVDKFQASIKTFAESHDDFHEVVESVDDIPMSLTVQEVVLGSDDGPEIMYELAKNPDEYKRICGLPAIAAAHELGKIEARLQKSSPSSQTKEQKTTKAPKPLTPVSSKSTNANLKSPDEMDYQQYKKWRDAHPNG